MRQAMKRIRALGVPVMDHALDAALAGSGVVHEGAYSRPGELPGIPSEAEVRIVERDVLLAERTGCPVHISTYRPPVLWRPSAAPGNGSFP